MKLAAPSATQITYGQLKLMCLCLALALAVHAVSVPAWILAIVASCAAARLALARRGYAAPARSIRNTIAALSVLLLFLKLHTFNGLAAGSALLSLVAGLKLLETQSRRDLYVIALIVYFLSLAALLGSESFWLLAYLLAVSWLTTATLLRLTARPPAWRQSARYAGRIAAQALPLALVLWLFFPRLNAPLWHTPVDARGAETGLSDSMSPGDITDLALSDEIAFRARFLGPTPLAAERYWRGPVLHDFDGRTWRRTIAPRAGAAAPLVPSGVDYRYVVSLEPNRHNWIFALDWPDAADLGDAILTGDYMVVRPSLVTRSLDVALSSHTRVQAAAPLSEAMRRRDTRLPVERNPRTAALARELRRLHPDDGDYLAAVLDMFRRQQFFYTLEPPPLGADAVDEFLFVTKRGFCGHYASAFAVLARAAGIPARIVTGYYGGTYNRFADYWIIGQSDAHAWDEVWIEGRGWVRIDPTSAIAPGRVEAGLGGSLASGSRLAGSWRSRLSWIADVRLELDALRQLWRERILHFDQPAQDRLLGALGIAEPDGEKIALAMAAGLALVFAWLTWQIRREQNPPPRDPVVRAYGRLCRKLAAAGLPRRAAEGAEAYAARIARERPAIGADVARLCRGYSRLRYGARRGAARERWFLARAGAFRPGRAIARLSPGSPPWDTPGTE